MITAHQYAYAVAAREQAIIDIFERTAPAVVNVFDRNLQGGGRSLSVDTPEGNGTGFIWDSALPDAPLWCLVLNPDLNFAA